MFHQPGTIGTSWHLSEQRHLCCPPGAPSSLPDGGFQSRGSNFSPGDGLGGPGVPSWSPEFGVATEFVFPGRGLGVAAAAGRRTTPRADPGGQREGPGRHGGAEARGSGAPTAVTAAPGVCTALGLRHGAAAQAG